MPAQAVEKQTPATESKVRKEEKRQLTLETEKKQQSVAVPTATGCNSSPDGRENLPMTWNPVSSCRRGHGLRSTPLPPP